MAKLNIYNKLFIAFFALLLMFIIWKVPHENNTSGKISMESVSH